ncbi:MAG: cytochrome c biogenesis CcdA family protein [Acidimicrobiales bacterium]
MIEVDLLLAFTYGIVITVNPCGFAMLPAYLSFFVGSEGDDAAELGLATTLGRSLVVGGAVTAGFVGAFAVLGLIVHTLTDGIYEVAAWISVVIGVALAAFGIALLRGFSPTFASPHLDRGGRSRGVGSMALFGVSYAVASVGCSLPLLLAYLVGSFNRGFASGIAFFVAFAVGFGLVITALTVTLGLGRRSLAVGLRRVLPYVNRIAGGLLVITGAYMAYYGSVEIRSNTTGRGATNDGITNRAISWSDTVAQWVNEVGAERIGLVLAVIVVAAVATVLATRRRASHV